MQYFKPADPYFVGDCMPFFHAGVFHLYYLLDENHHAALGGLGGHQWAHASTTDLVHWTHHPLAIPITHDWEGSICTGSTFFHEGTYYGFYATRMRDRTQHLSVATSTDGIHFQKTEPNPYASPPPDINPYDYRDPFVFWDAGSAQFHMLVSASFAQYPLHNYGGCLAHLTSSDLKSWAVQPPFLIPGLPGVPECSDYFHWNGWYYLIFSHGLVAHYRMSRQPFGPWLRPAVDTFDGGAAWVMKTAPFTGDRRIGAAFLPTREGDVNAGRYQWAGQMVLREIIQHSDGTLGTKFPAEVVPASGSPVTLSPQPLTPDAAVNAGTVILSASDGLEVARIGPLPRRARLRLRVTPDASAVEYGLYLRGAEDAAGAYHLRFLPHQRRVELFDQALSGVTGLHAPFTLDIILEDSIIDVCIDQRRTLINRCPEDGGDYLFCYAHCSAAQFDAIEITPLLPK
ncbi:MAG: hypothetical protein R3E39_09400 [Anaerolineae bacterium]